MTEAAAIRYLISKGWTMMGEGWFRLQGAYESPVCVETAYHLQRAMERVSA